MNQITTLKYYDNKLEKYMIANIYDDVHYTLHAEDIDILKTDIRNKLNSIPGFGLDIDIHIHSQLIGDVTNITNIIIRNKYTKQEISRIPIKHVKVLDTF